MGRAERGEGNLGPNKATAKSTVSSNLCILSAGGRNTAVCRDLHTLLSLLYVRGIAFRNTRQVPGFLLLKMKGDQKSFQDLKRFFLNLLYFRKDNETNLAIYIEFSYCTNCVLYIQRNEIFCYRNTSQKHGIEQFKGTQD